MHQRSAVSTTSASDIGAPVLELRPEPFASLELIRSALRLHTPMGTVHEVLPRAQRTTARSVIRAAVHSLRPAGLRALNGGTPSGQVDLTVEVAVDAWCAERLADRVLGIDHDHVEELWRAVHPGLGRRGRDRSDWAGAVAVAAAGNPLRVDAILSLLYGEVGRGADTDALRWPGPTERRLVARRIDPSDALSLCLSKAAQQADNCILGGAFFHAARLVEGARPWVVTDLAERNHLIPKTNQRREVREFLEAEDCTDLATVLQELPNGNQVWTVFDLCMALIEQGPGLSRLLSGLDGAHRSAMRTTMGTLLERSSDHRIRDLFYRSVPVQPEAVPTPEQRSPGQWADSLIRLLLGLVATEGARHGLRLLRFEPSAGWSECDRVDRAHPAWWDDALHDAATFGCCDEPQLVDYVERGIALHHLTTGAARTLASWQRHATTRRAINELDPAPNRWRRNGARRALRALNDSARLRPVDDLELLVLAVTWVRTSNLPRRR